MYTVPPPDSHTFLRFDTDCQCIPRLLSGEKRRKLYKQIVQMRETAGHHLPSFSMSQYAVTGWFPDPPESTQYRPLGTSPPELFLISWHEAAGSSEKEPSVAV